MIQLSLRLRILRKNAFFLKLFPKRSEIPGSVEPSFSGNTNAIRCNQPFDLSLGFFSSADAGEGR